MDDREARIARLEEFARQLGEDDDLICSDGDATAGDLRIVLADAKRMVSIATVDISKPATVERFLAERDKEKLS